MCLELADDSVMVQHPAVRAGGQPSPVKRYQSVEQGVPCYEPGYYRLFLEPKDLPLQQNVPGRAEVKVPLNVNAVSAMERIHLLAV